MNDVMAAFETEEAFEARLARLPEQAKDWERRDREAALWEKRTREELIAAMNRLSAAIALSAHRGEP